MKTLAVRVDDQNVETKLYLDDSGVACIRVRDLDADENYSLVRYPTEADAFKAYNATPKFTLRLV